jgi:radical SAM superfamily enzyme YgiQ (UPF0313 family)
LKKILFVAINSKYPHTNLAVRVLRNELDYIHQPCRIIEHNINSHPTDVFENMKKNKSEVYAFSCYIWNINFVISLAKRMKKHDPSCKILFGGPEVSFESQKLMKDNKCIDYIIYGEGEKPIKDFSAYLNNTLRISDCSSLIYRKNKTIISNDSKSDNAFSQAPFPYQNLDTLKNRVIYYEASRGCPYKCGFCLSSLTKKYHEKNIETVKNDLKIFIDHQVKIVKFVDRTFNTNKKRAKEIIEFISDNNVRTCFHLEIAPSLLDDDFVSLLNRIPTDFVQIEIGIQSTHQKTLKAVNRNEDFALFNRHIKNIIVQKNIHVHVDLIAGLPYEGFIEFERSFNDVFSLRADNLQLGFLKLLKGSPLRQNAKKLGIVYEKHAPYTFIKTKHLSKKEVLCLDEIEYLLKRFYNSSLFFNSINYLAYMHGSAFQMFLSLNDFIKKSKLEPKKLSEQDLSKTLLDFSKNDLIVKQFIIFDVLNKKKKPKLVPYLFSHDFNAFKNAFYDTNKDMNKSRIIPVKFTVDIQKFNSENMLTNQPCILIFDYSDFDSGVLIRPFKKQQ